ncbi:MAG TPA: adenylate/guanylate cyclase domain-containing protein [Solirubrobacteraceae bacterium]|nr:adenylate/guanylate cyclase domain-containing protein [Solirubrobacteraceae bacterium]
MSSGTGALECYVPRMLLWRGLDPTEEFAELLDGTMVFADVSGFTKLSERLARTGKEGAEHLVDAINACFSALLGNAYARGGSLLKFGGDAMLLWFEGDEHVQRACASAAEMRRTLREVGRIRAGGSEVVLRMSVGVHSGSYAMLLVGGSHRELLIGGRAATTVVAMEGLASAGQILVSADTASVLPRGCLGDEVGSGTLLARTPTPREWTPSDGFTLPSEEAMARTLSTTVRAHILNTHAPPEHRTAAIAFLQFRGLDEMIDEQGMTVTRERLDHLVRIVQEACDRYEICFLDSDVSSDGGKIRLSAGAPRAVGDDDERMLLALREIIEAELPMPVQAGVNRGPVFTGEVGPAYRRWYAVMGDTVNLAARLMGKAPAGHVYATRDVLRYAKTRFEETALEPFSVKGKSRPVQAWDVGPPVRATSDVLAISALPLVGRDAELGLLRGALDEARRGAGGAIELAGETGSGKSRLLAEALKLGEGMRVLQTTCEVFTRDTPYSTWRDLLRQLLGVGWDDPAQAVLARLVDEIGRTVPDLLPWLPLIAIVLDLEASPTKEVEQLAAESRAAKLHEVVLRFLGRELVVPTIVEVEHAHLMDAASAALFGALARDLGSSAWLLLVTRRDASGGLVLAEETCTRIELGPLSRDDIHAIALAAPEAERLPPHVVELAVERSGGSPEFLIDLLAAAAAGDRDELPESVGAATMARIDALDSRDGAVVRRAAVLGLTFHPRRLADVVAPGMPLPEEGFWDRLSEVFSREADGHVQFKRPALQEAAYASLPFKLRRELHKAVGLRLEHDQGRELDADPAVLSHHFSLAGDHGRAHRYAMVAAKRATERFSHADAARLYRRAIDAGRADGAAADPRALAAAWEDLGEALRAIGEPAAAMRALTEARRLVRDDPIAQARLCDRHAEVAKRSESLTVAVRWLNRGLRCVEALDDLEATAWRARIRSNLGGIRLRQARHSAAIFACRIAIAEADSVGELRAVAHASYVLDMALVESGRPDEATHSWRALEIYQQLGDPEHESLVLNNLGAVAYFNGRWDDAVSLYRRAAASSERAGRPADLVYTNCNIGEILSDQGHLDEAEVHLQRARQLGGATGEQQSVACVDLFLGRLFLRQGKTRESVSTVESALADIRRFRLDWYADFANAVIAEAEAFGGDPIRALEIASRELEANDRLRPMLSRAAGIAFARMGEKPASIRELRHALKAARDRRADYDIAATIDALAALEDAEPELLADRDEILERLKIKRLPAPMLVPAR